MADIVQIKRSLLSVAPSSLAEGEFAYTYGNDTLYLGAPGSTIIIIGGASTFAKLLSPAFTGTPIAPTAAGGTNTTQIATTAYVLAAIASGAITIDSIPVNGSTNAVSSDGVFDALALKAPLASPTFSGTPSLPTGTTGTTQSTGDNTTKLATTAFVKATIDAILNGAGAAYDTLKELQDLLVGDESTASALATTVSGKLQKDQNLSDLTNAVTARTNLGLGSMATQAASAVAITGGTIDGVTIDGGTF